MKGQKVRKSVTDLKTCACTCEESVALIRGLLFLSVCRVRPYAINTYVTLGTQSSPVFGSLNSEAVRQTERVKFILDVTPWQ